LIAADSTEYNQISFVVDSVQCSQIWIEVDSAKYN